jgi:hypothetical protein
MIHPTCIPTMIVAPPRYYMVCLELVISQSYWACYYSQLPRPKPKRAASEFVGLDNQVVVFESNDEQSSQTAAILLGRHMLLEFPHPSAVHDARAS